MKAFPFGTNGLDLVNTSCAVLQGDQTLILYCSPKETRLLSCVVLQRRPDSYLVLFSKGDQASILCCSPKEARLIRNDRIALLQVEVASGA